MLFADLHKLAIIDIFSQIIKINSIIYNNKNLNNNSQQIVVPDPDCELDNFVIMTSMKIVFL